MSCREFTKKTILIKFKMWINHQKDRHDWQYFAKKLRSTTYNGRKCECGREEVRCDGPMGDDSWRNIDWPWKFSWAKDDYKQAKIIE